MSMIPVGGVKSHKLHDFLAQMGAKAGKFGRKAAEHGKNAYEGAKSGAQAAGHYMGENPVKTGLAGAGLLGAGVGAHHLMSDDDDMDYDDLLKKLRGHVGEARSHLGV